LYKNLIELKINLLNIDDQVYKNEYVQYDLYSINGRLMIENKFILSILQVTEHELHSDHCYQSSFWKHICESIKQSIRLSNISCKFSSLIILVYVRNILLLLHLLSSLLHRRINVCFRIGYLHNTRKIKSK